MKRFLILLGTMCFLIFTGSGCRTLKNTNSSHTAISQRSDTSIINQHDSNYYSKIQTIQDTQFIIKPDSASILALIQCNHKGEAFLKQIIQLKNGRKISQSISLKDNVLTVKAKIDSAAIYFQYKETHIKEGRSSWLINRNKQSEKTQITDKKQTKKTVTKWPTWLYFLIAGAAAWLFYKYVLPFISPWIKMLR